MGGRGVALVCVAAGLAATGCPAKPLPPLDPAALRATEARTLVVAVDRSPPITAEGPAREGLRLTLPLLMTPLVNAGRDQIANQKRARWMRGCDVDDPVEDIRDDVAEALAAAMSLHVLEPARRTKAKDPEDVIQDYPGADLILDIRTSKWGIHRIKAPSPHNKVHFAVGYEGSVRLIDVRKRTVLAEGTCSIQFSNGDDPSTITELLEDDCALLDKGLALDAATCTRRHLETLGLE